MTWEDWCLEKLGELGRATIKEWGKAMGLIHPGSLRAVIKRLDGKLKIIRNKSTRTKYYEVRKQ